MGMDWIHLPCFLCYTLHKKMKLCSKDFFGKCDQIRSLLRIWPHLLKKSLIENFIFCTVITPNPKMCCSSKFLLFYHFHHRPFRIICENPETMHFQKISTNISPFIPNAPFLYAQKTSENLTVFWCSQELEKRYIGNKWVNWKNGTLCSEWSHGIYN